MPWWGHHAAFRPFALRIGLHCDPGVGIWFAVLVPCLPGCGTLVRIGWVRARNQCCRNWCILRERCLTVRAAQWCTCAEYVRRGSYEILSNLSQKGPPSLSELFHRHEKIARVDVTMLVTQLSQIRETRRPNAGFVGRDYQVFEVHAANFAFHIIGMLPNSLSCHNRNICYAVQKHSYMLSCRGDGWGW